MVVLDSHCKTEVRLDGTDRHDGFYIDPLAFKDELVELESQDEEEWRGDTETEGSLHVALSTTLTMVLITVSVTAVVWWRWRKGVGCLRKKTAEDVEREDIRKLERITEMLASMNVEIENDLANASRELGTTEM